MSAARLWWILPIGLTVGLSAQQSTRPPARDASAAASTAANTASIAGTIVTDDASPQPVRRAMVTATDPQGSGEHTTFTNDAGRFTFSGLPASRYLIAATKTAYVRTAYGASRYDRPGTPVTVTAGQSVANLVLKMSRGAVITGRILDENGQPSVATTVRASLVRTVDGARTLTPASVLGGSDSSRTDDHGTYRLFGLPPGDYVVSIAPMAAAGGEIRATTPAEIQSVQHAIQAASQPGAATTPMPAPEPITVNYTTVFYPSATNPSDATVLSLTAGEERSGVDLAAQLVRTARVTGMVVVPAGVPPRNVQLMLLPDSPAIGVTMLARVAPAADGSFSYAGVAPGKYQLSARTTVPNGSGANANAPAPAAAGPMRMMMPTGTGGQVYWGQADVTVNGEPVSGVTIAMQPGLTMTGRTDVAPGSGAPPDFTRLRLNLAPAPGANGIMIGAPFAEVDPNGHFSMTGITPGRYRMAGTMTGPGAPWTASSILVRGRDVLDVPLEIGPTDDLSNVVVTLTSQTQEVSGTLQDASGRAAPDFTVVIFPADRALWTSPRRVRTTRPGTDGHFTFPGLPPGDYRVAAVVDVTTNEATQPSFLEEVSGASVAVTLHAGEKKVQDFRIGG